MDKKPAGTRARARTNSASPILSASDRRRSADILRKLWDDGVASGYADPDETIDDIKKAARQTPPSR